jgi:hypothetical protein
MADEFGTSAQTTAQATAGTDSTSTRRLSASAYDDTIRLEGLTWLQVNGPLYLPDVLRRLHRRRQDVSQQQRLLVLKFPSEPSTQNPPAAVDWAQQRDITLIDEQKVRNIHFPEEYAEFCTALLPCFLLSFRN